MNVVKNPDAWRAIAYWLSIEQLVALILSGDRWMITVLSNSPYLQGISKYYPIASLLSGLVKWKIPEPNPIRPDSSGVISFPPYLRSLSVALLDRPALYFHTVRLPISLTSLDIGNDQWYQFRRENWLTWSTAIRTLVELRSISIAHESQGILAGQFAVLGGTYPNLTNLTVGTLDNTSWMTLDSLLPPSLTKLSISHVINETNLHTKVLTLTNLSSLTLSSKCFRVGNHDLMRHLPAQLQELVVVDDSDRDLGIAPYYMPIAVLGELPRNITALDVWTFIPNDEQLTALERLPLKSLKLQSKLNPLALQEDGNFSGSFPGLVELKCGTS